MSNPTDIDFSLLQEVEENLPGVLFRIVLSQEGELKLTYAGGACKEIFGLEAHEVINDLSRITDLLSPDDRKAFASSLKRSAVSLEPWNWIGHFFMPTGEVKWIKSQSQPRKCKLEDDGNCNKGDVIWSGMLLDITDRMEAAEELKIVRRQMEEAQHLAHMGSWDYDVETGRTDWSDETFRILGLDPEQHEADFSLYLDRIHPDDVGKAREALQKALNGEGVDSVETRIVLPDNEMRYTLNIGESVKRGGKVRQLIGTVVDITDRVKAIRAEQERREKAVTFKDILVRLAQLNPENLDSGLEEITRAVGSTMDVERTSIWFFNKANTAIHCAKLYWRSKNKHVKGSVLKRDEFPNYFSALQNESVIVANDAVNDARTAEFSEAYLKPQNIRSMMDVPIWYDGKLWGVMCLEHMGDHLREWTFEEQDFATNASNIVTRIMESAERHAIEKKLEESEKRWKYALEGSQDGVWDWNLKTGEVYYSPQWKAMLGYSYHEIPNDFEGWKSLLHPDDKERAVKRAEGFVSSGQEHYLNEFRLRCKDGSYKWIFARGKILEYDKEGAPLRFVGTHVDVTDRRRQEEELRKAKEMAEKASRAKADFLSTMSHEIRTPMNAVIGMTHLLREEHPRDDQKESLEILQFSAENLLALINDILDYNKIDAGKITLEEVSFDLRLLADNLRQSFMKKAADKELALTTAVDETLPIMLKGDPTRLNQVLTNLISNAIKFTSEGKVSLVIEQEGDQHKGKLPIRFTVRDTGIGIPEDKQEKIFESFAQAGSDTARNFGGTGLGLAISKRLVQLLGGEIELDSIPGKGSVFSFMLWLTPSAESSPDEKVPIANLKGMKGAKVLLVEDNLVNRNIALRFLQKWDMVVTVAGNGKEALEKVQRDDYQLVLMDLQMPVMDGYEATRAIRELEGEQYKELPIVALTASAMLEVQEKVYAVGMSDYITKPVEPKLLHQKIARHIRQW